MNYKYLPVTSCQKRLWAFFVMNPKSKAYNLSFVNLIKGNLKIPILRKAIQEVVSQHEILRTNFTEKNGKIMQKIKKKAKIKICVKDINYSINSHLNKIIDIVQKECSCTFNLRKGMLINAKILKLKNRACILIITAHHIILDEWSARIFYKGLSNLYNKYIGIKQEKSKDIYQYEQFTEWEVGLSKNFLENQKKYWLKELEGELSLVDLPTDKLRPKVNSYNTSIFGKKINRNIVKKLEEFSKEKNITLFNIIFALYNLFLHKITLQNDIVAGTPVSLRNSLEAYGMMGMFINTLVIRSRFSNEMSFTDLVYKLKSKISKSLDNKYYSFDDLVRDLNLGKRSNYPSLCNVFFQFIDKTQLEYDFERLKSENIWIDNKESQFDLTLAIIKNGKELELKFYYNIDLFEPKTIRHLVDNFIVLLDEAINNSSLSISKLKLTSISDNKSLDNLNKTNFNYPRDNNIHGLISAQSRKNPRLIAIQFLKEEITYGELEEKSNQLARVLFKKGVSHGDCVGLYIERSIKLAVSMLAVLKIGAFYIVINDKYPQKRILYILKDAGIRLVITDKKNCNKIKNKKAQILNLNIEQDRIVKEQKKQLNIRVRSGDLACAIYTSGSTGKSKGVLLCHRGILNHIFTKIRITKVNKRDILCQNLESSFVASIWQFFCPLILGGKLIIYNDEVSNNPINLFDKVIEDKISVLEVIPSFLNLFLSMPFSLHNRKIKLKILILTGEKVEPGLVKRFYKKYNIALINAYGQSECSDDTLHYKIPRNFKNDRVPLGIPSNNTRVYILDNNLNIQPRNIVGEICISGEGLSRGYLNDLEKTKRVFVRHPFIKEEIIFKTRDLGRINNCGLVEYIGRKDRQIQVRGNRVEPEEIETTVKSIKKIKDCLVIEKNDWKNENTLVVYYLTDEDLEKEKIEDHIKRFLPDYMVPSYFFRVNKIPFNSNGKKDYLYFKKIDDIHPPKYKKNIKKTKIERIICNVWSEILHIKNIGINANFFDIGGHSITAIEMVSRLKRKGIDIPLSIVFVKKTVKELALFINRRRENKEKKHGGVPLTIFRNRKQTHVLNQISVYDIPSLDTNLLELTFKKINKLFPENGFILGYYKENNFQELEINENFFFKINEYFVKSSMEKYLIRNIKTYRQKRKGILFVFIKKEREYKLVIKENNFNDNQINKILLNFQKIYNLNLVGIINGESDNIYFPILGHQTHHDCFINAIREFIQWKYNIFLPQSILPGLCLSALPNYVVIDEKRRRDNVINSEILGYKDNLGLLKIKYKIVGFDKFSYALKYLEKKTDDNKAVILLGSPHHLPFFISYQDKRFDNFYKKSDVILRYYTAIFFKNNSKYYVNSPNLRYFGEISLEDLKKFWLLKSDGLKKYSVVELIDGDKIKETRVEVLVKALRMNVDEFYRNRIVGQSKIGKFKRIYFGRQSIFEFEKDIKREIPDILILNLAKNLEKPYLVLLELLIDIYHYKKIFSEDFSTLENIMDRWNTMYLLLLEESIKKGLKYNYRISLLPEEKLYNKRFISKKGRESILKMVSEIKEDQERLFRNLKKEIC